MPRRTPEGAIGMFSAFIAYQFGVVMRWPGLVAVLLAMAFAAAFGWFMERFTLRPLRERPVLTRVIVTLGWLLVLHSLAGILFGDTSYHVPLQIFPQNGITFGSLTLGYNQIANILVAGGLAVGLGLFLKLSPLGVFTHAARKATSAASAVGSSVVR